MITSTLLVGCGPYLDLEGTSLWVAITAFLVLKPLAYFGFIQAFRYRVSRPIPMTIGQALKLTAARAGLGIAFFAAGAAAVVFSGSTSVLMWSWLYLYLARAAAWLIVGRWGAVLRGRRLAGWVIAGLVINAAFDFAALAGLLEGWAWPAAVFASLCVFIGLLDRVGRRASLRARFSAWRHCARCHYDLTGNLSGCCPECGQTVAEAA
jgi:hypothetical protein